MSTFSGPIFLFACVANSNEWVTVFARPTGSATSTKSSPTMNDNDLYNLIWFLFSKTFTLYVLPDSKPSIGLVDIPEV